MESSISTRDQTKNKTNKGLVILLVIAVLFLATSVGVMLSKLNDQRIEAAEVQEILEGQKKLLEDDLTDLQEQFGSLQTNNDSLMNLAAEQQARITRLLAIQANNAQTIRTYQRELETLREVLRSYIIQVDSLNQSNIALRAERIELSRDLAAERSQTARLTQDRDRLTSTVQIAQVLAAGNVQTTGLNNRGNETPRARNVDKLRTCFVVRENPVAAPGDKIIYIVILLPDKRTLANRANATFQTQDGDEIVFTDRRTISYENSDIDVCIFCDNDNRLVEGNYEVRLYCDGHMIGRSTFELR